MGRPIQERKDTSLTRQMASYIVKTFSTNFLVARVYTYTFCSTRTTPGSQVQRSRRVGNIATTVFAQRARLLGIRSAIITILLRPQGASRGCNRRESRTGIAIQDNQWTTGKIGVHYFQVDRRDSSHSLRISKSVTLRNAITFQL